MFGINPLSSAPISALPDSTSNSVTGNTHGAIINGWVLDGAPLGASIYTGWGGYGSTWATADGYFVLNIPIAGSGYSQATSNVTLVPQVILLGNESLSTSVSGDLSKTVNLASSSAAVSVTTAGMLHEDLLSAVATVSPIGSGSIKISTPLSTASGAVVTGAGVFTLTIRFTGSGQSVVTSNTTLIPVKVLLSNITTLSASTGAVAVGKILGATLSVLPTGTGSIAQTTKLAAAAVSTATSSTTLTVLRPLASSVTVVSSTTGAVGVAKNMVVNAVVNSTGTGGIVDRIPLAAAAVSETTSTPDLRLVKPIAGSGSSSTSTATSVLVDVKLSATVLTLVSSNAELRIATVLSGLEGTGAVTNVVESSLKVVKRLAGDSPSEADGSGDLVSTHAIELADILGGTSAEVSYQTIVADASIVGAGSTYEYQQITATAELLTIAVESTASPIYGEATYTQIVAEAETLDINFKLAA